MAKEVSDDDMMTPEEALIDSARYGELEEVMALLEAIEPAVNVNAADPGGNTALHRGNMIFCCMWEGQGTFPSPATLICVLSG